MATDQPSFLSRLRSPTERRGLAVSVLKRLQPLLDLLARSWRATFGRSVRVVAVVGSYGKSTTMRVGATVLCGDVHRYATNNTGVFLGHSVLRLRPWHRHAVVEVGIARPGGMDRPAALLSPDVVVVTSIGSEHHRSFHTLEATRAEKAKMVEALSQRGVALLNGDDENVSWMESRTSARVVTYGLGEDNDFRATDAEVVPIGDSFGTRFTAVCEQTGAVAVETLLLGLPGLYAALAGFALGVLEGRPVAEILERLGSVEPTEGRLQPVRLDSGALLVRDDYKGSVETWWTAIDLLESIPAARRICVLGEVEEAPTGGERELYRRLGERAGRVFDEVVMLCALGRSAKLYRVGARRAGVAEDAIFDASAGVHAAIEHLTATLGPGDVVLVKGRMTQRLDRIGLALSGRTVRCDLSFCRLGVTRCHHCPLLGVPSETVS